MRSLNQWTPPAQEPAIDPSSTSMSDVAWNLMLTVLVACVSLVPASQATLQDADLKLARSRPSSAVDEDQETIRLTINGEGVITLEQQPIGSVADVERTLPEALRDVLQSREEPAQVWVAPDRRVGWEDVVRVHDVVRGVTDRVSFITEEVQE